VYPKSINITTFAKTDDNNKLLRGVIINTIINIMVTTIDKQTFCVVLANSTIKGVGGIKIYLYFIFYTYNINE
jgi:hypothetical protein